MTIPSLYNVNDEEDKEDTKESINSNRKEYLNTNTDTNTNNFESNTNASKERYRLPKQRQKQEFIKANIITVITTLTAITIAFLLQIPIGISLAIWLSSFVIDAVYTYKNRRLIGYELNYLVRYSKALYNTLLFGFLLVFAIEVILLLLLSVTVAYMNNSNIADTVSVFSMLFTVLHLSAFVRSYRFVKDQRNK